MQSRIFFALFLVWGICSCYALSKPFSHMDLFTSTNTNATNCPSMYTCVSDGDTCSHDWTTDSIACFMNNGTNCCANGLYCIAGTCQENYLGVSCNNISSPCYGQPGESLICNTTSKTCQYVYGVGDGCTTSADCENGLNCTDSLCMAASVGENCTVDFLCNFGLYCNITNPTNPTNNICVNAVPAGGSCTAKMPCYPGYYCLNGNCTAYYSVAAGGSCTNSDQCADNNICPLGKCVAPVTSMPSCSTNSDCSNNATCVCSLFSGSSFCVSLLYNACAEQSEDLANCLVDNNCTSASANPNSCAYNNCYSDLKKSQSCGCDDAENIYSSCSYNQYCGGFPVWAIIVIIIAAIVLVLGIVLLVFFMMRRRRVYDSI